MIYTEIHFNKSYFSIILITVSAIVLCLGLTGCFNRPDQPQVIIYVSVDRQQAEPLLKAYEQATGVTVKAVYDVEAAKVTGLVNRLIQEKQAPRADVFWNGEVVQTMKLKQHGVLAAYDSPSTRALPLAYRDIDNYWHGAGGRARVILINTDMVTETDCPSNLEDMLDPERNPSTIGIAIPLFGTTATHAAALYALWGPDKARNFFRRVQARGIQVVNGNSVVRDMVVDGRLHWGITDTDDAYGAVDKGFPVRVIPLDHDGIGTLIIPYTVALVAGGPNPKQAKKLLDFLVGPQAEAQLIQSGFSQLSAHGNPVPNDLASIKPMDVTFDAVLKNMERMQRESRKIFVQ